MNYAITTTSDVVNAPQFQPLTAPSVRRFLSILACAAFSFNGLPTSNSSYCLTPYVNIVPAPDSSMNDWELKYNGGSITVMGSCEMSCNMKSIAKLRSFLNLPDNWNGYGARPFSKGYVKYAEYLLRRIPYTAEVFPIPDGRVQFEFDKDDGAYLEFEINDDYSIGVLEMHPDKPDREFTSTPEDLIRIVTEFYG